jgi:hypothetical protein
MLILTFGQLDMNGRILKRDGGGCRLSLGRPSRHESINRCRGGGDRLTETTTITDPNPVILLNQELPGPMTIYTLEE